MNIKKIIALIIIFVLFFTGAIIYVLHGRNEDTVDVVAVNDIAESVAEHFDTLGQCELPCLSYGLDYAVIDLNDNLVASTNDESYYDINKAIENRDTIVDLKTNDKLLGKLIIYNNIGTRWRRKKQSLFFMLESMLIIVAICCLAYVMFLNRVVILPFRKLKEFARHVAEGNLDMPLNMDRKNIFGIFTESFDLMRSEIKCARENERNANQSKKELVASLSHDIKTPVASIKAVSEIMYVKSKDECEKEQLEIISEKADQINTLITNLFNATLEELQELKVTVSEQSSQIIYGLIKNADYNSQVTNTGISECIVVADDLRLSQVIDNVICNAYKYAGTSINVSGKINGQYLEIVFLDYGKGVSEEERPLLFNKFYRAKNSDGKSGAGLGLYISKYLMNKMSGDIECENTSDGFLLRLKLLIA